MKKKAIITVIILLVIAIAWVFVSPLIGKKDLRSALADIFNTHEKDLVLNMPPSPSRYPGTVLIPLGRTLTVLHTNDSADANIKRGKPFDISATLDNFSDFESQVSAGFLDAMFKNKQHFGLEIEIKKGRILEIDLSNLKAYVEENETVRNAADKGNKPIILNKAYEGIVSYNISAKDEKGAEILKEISKEAKEVSKRNKKITLDGGISESKGIRVNLNERIIIAFEGVAVDFIINHLGPDGADVQLTPLTKQEIAELNQGGPERFIPNLPNAGSDIRWGLVTIGSGHYSKLATINVPEAVESAQTVNAILSKYDPVFNKSLVSTETQPISDDSIMNWTIDLSLQLLENPVDHLIVYYAGHALSLPNGEMVLLNGNIDKDFAEKAALALSPDQSSAGDGNLLAETLYNSFEMTGVPFTLMLDACYPNDEMQEALSRVSMQMAGQDGSQLLYTGNEFYITNETQQLAEAVWKIGERFPYRKEQNAVIFSSKPGTKAMFRDNPYSYFSKPLAPLASRIALYDMYNNPVSSTTLGNLITALIDTKQGIGEISLSGTSTWSELDELAKLNEVRMDDRLWYIQVMKDSTEEIR